VRDRPIIVAHRGLHQAFPENSIAAFTAAWTREFTWCECDVWLLADGTPVVLHDETLDRTTTAWGKASSSIWSELRPIHLRDQNGQPTEHHLPPLAYLLRAMPKDAGLLVEIKPPNSQRAVDLVVEMLRRLSENQRCIVQSFDESNVRMVTECDPPLPVAYLIEEPETLMDAHRSPWPRIHVKHDLLDEVTIRPLRREQKSIGVWTPNTESELRRVIELGVDMIITDEPLLARKLVEEMR
jgi:glycerophosphoryl diester phosphodiesterase